MVVRKTEYPRSYLVKTEKGGMLRRNRSALLIICRRKNPETVHSDIEDSEITQNPKVENEETLSTSNTETTTPLPATTTISLENSQVPPQVTRSGRNVKPPTRLDL